MNEGKLVPEEIIFALLSKRLEEGYCRGETGFILDGIPRTRIQAVSAVLRKFNILPKYVLGMHSNWFHFRSFKQLCSNFAFCLA